MAGLALPPPTLIHLLALCLEPAGIRRVRVRKLGEESQGNKTHPSYSPDGERIAFTVWGYEVLFFLLRPGGNVTIQSRGPGSFQSRQASHHPFLVLLGGPVRIAKFSGEQLSLGWANFVAFAALISINLAFINLLPIPALDGGHLAFYAAEAVRRKPLGPRSQEWAFRTGLAFVLALMLFVTINDIASLFGS